MRDGGREELNLQEDTKKKKGIKTGTVVDEVGPRTSEEQSFT